MQHTSDAELKGHTMTNKQALYDAMAQESARRERAHKIDGIIGGIICTALGACVLSVIVLWFAR